MTAIAYADTEPMIEAEKALIQLEDITKTYDAGENAVQALDGIDVAIEYGQSYPLASWGFDSSQGPAGFGGAPSGELGYGPPDATAAANTDRWSYTIPATANVGDIYTFFCRIHPKMRGFLEVVS